MVNKQIKLGARVRVMDGETGTVEQIVVDPKTQQPGYLVIKYGRLPPRQRRIVAPVSLVSEASAREITLATTREALQQFPDYEVTVHKGKYEKPQPIGYPNMIGTYVPPSNAGYMALKQRTVPETNIGVQQGMSVLDADGNKVGQVHGIIANPESRQAKTLVVQHTDRFRTYAWLVPVDLVADVRADAILLHIKAEQMYGLSLFQPVAEQSSDIQEHVK
jgi:sporulation protein YlmC with PRC-barrel domain